MSELDIPTFDFSDCSVISDFFRSDALVRVLRGSVGSGKSTACCLEIQRRAFAQEPSKDGIRRFTAGIVRATSPMLQRTTLRTWHAIFPPNAPGATFKYSPPMRYELKIKPSGDTPGLELGVDFFAMDTPAAAENLLSYECSMLFFNEAREFDKQIIDRAIDRVGRYPNRRYPNVGCTWRGVILDTNPPDEDHWLAKLDFDSPENWDFFCQPPAILECKEVERDGKRTWVSVEGGYNREVDNPDYVIKAANTFWMINPDAENLRNLPVDPKFPDPLHKTSYYLSGASSKDRDFIRTYYQGHYGATHSGRAVIPEFNPVMQVFEDIQPIDGGLVYAGLDVGAGTLNPACVLAQRFPRGNWIIFDEICPPTEGIGLEEFSTEIVHRIKTMFPHSKFERGWGDPAGEVRDGLYEQTCFDFLMRKGLRFMAAATTNDIRNRINAIKAPCAKLIDGKPGLLIHKRCKMLIKGLKGGWSFRRMQIGGAEERYKDVPDKNKYSHVCDALGYLLMGAGEGRQRSLDEQRANLPASVEHDFNPLAAR
jgi:hypothetical protein